MTPTLKRSLLLLAGLIALASSSAHADKKKPSGKKSAAVVNQPAIELVVKSGGTLEDFATNNTWMKDFATSNLHDGLMVRLGQVLHAFPTGDQEKTWTGSLEDFALRQLIKAKPMVLAYYTERGLVSPFAVAFPDVDATELAIFQTLIKYFGHGPSESVVVKADDDLGHHETPLPTSAARIGLYKFAYRINGNCLALSRDPALAASLAETCKDRKTPASDLEASIDWMKFAQPLKGFLRKYVQTSGLMKVEGSFANHSFNLQRASMPWINDAHLGAASSLAGALHLLPSQTMFFTALPLNSPRDLSKETARAYLSGAPGGVPMDAVVFGVEAENEFETGLLLSRKNIAQDLQSVSGLMNESSATSVHLLCDGEWVLLTPFKTLYEQIAKNCAPNSPSIEKLRAAFVDKMKAPAQHRVFINLPALGEAFVRSGWAREDHKSDLPQELQKTITLLARWPQIYASGQIQGDQMVYEITQGEL